MKILVCGSRDFTDSFIINRLLDLYSPTSIVTGGAKGADAVAATYAVANSIRVDTYPAMWDTHGLAAGPIRNERMLSAEHPDLILAFVNKPLAKSIGTADMVRRGRKAGIRTYVVEAGGEPTFFLDDSSVDTNCPEIFGGKREPISITAEEAHRLFRENRA